jgi:hypothetical protein
MNSVQIPQSACLFGVARCDVTPPVGIYHRMWGAATHDRATGVHRPLTATAVAFHAAQSPHAGGSAGSVDDPSGHGAGHVIVALDHCMLEDQDLALIRGRVSAATSFPPERIHISLSHTHGTGMMMRDRIALPGGEMIGPYLNEMARSIGRTVREAERKLRPARMLYATGRCDLATNRDYYDEEAKRYVCGFNPERPADDTVTVARVIDEETGVTIATIVNYACHPTTLAWENTLISPDYVGAMREVVETATGGVPCVFLQGASGDLGPRQGFVGDPAVADRNGRRLGYAAVGALESIPGDVADARFNYKGYVVSGAILGTWGFEKLPQEQEDRLFRWRYRSWTIDLPYRTDLPTLEESRDRLQGLIAEEAAAKKSGDQDAAQRLHPHVEQMTRQVMRLASMPPGKGFPLAVTLFQLGNAYWLTLAAEHYSELQMKLRQRFPNRSIVIATITDGWQPGYLPRSDTYGKGIYQESIAMVAPGALERVIEQAGDQIAQWEA